MKILFLSTRGEGLGVANRASMEGNTVSIFSRGDVGKAGEGMLSKVGSWRPELVKNNLIVCDTPMFFNFEDVLASSGKPVLGCSKLGYMLMNQKREDFLMQCGVATRSKIEHIVTVHAWFNGRDWVRPFLILWNENHLLPGNLGPVVECMGSVIKRIKGDPPFAEEIGKNLSKLGIRDFVTISYGWDGEELFPVGVFCGMMYDAMETMIEGLFGDISDVMFEVATGTLKQLDITSDYMISVRMTAPPWPYMSTSRNGCQIFGIDEGNLKHIFLCDVYKDDDIYVGGSDSGIILKATARGRSIEEAQRRVYRTLGNLDIAHKQYRIDIGDGATDHFATWHKRGLINE